MVICSCNVISDHQVRAVAHQVASVSEVYACLGCKPCCGVCARSIRKVLVDARGSAAAACATACPHEGESCAVVERVLEIVQDFERGLDGEGQASWRDTLSVAAE